MPNNLVFNNSADSLRTHIYGATSGGAITSIMVDSTGIMQVGGSISATFTGGEVTATVNGSVTATVNGSVTATVNGSVTATVNGSVTATVNGSVTATVNGSVTATVNGSVTATVNGSVTATVNGSVTATVNGSVSVTLASHGFTSSSASLTGLTTDLTNTDFVFDTSTIKDYTFYIRNVGADTVAARLQISPTLTEAFFANDTTLQILITPGQNATLVPGIFLNYTRLEVYGSPSATFTVTAFFNGQF